MTDLTVTDDLTGAAAPWIERALNRALELRERASFAVSGGGTPVPIYRALARRGEVDWARVDLYFADERCVPRDHDDSNFKLVLENFLDEVVGALPTVHRMEGEDPDADAAARRYAVLLPPVLDVVLLGMGPDGHTASLFPNQPLVEEPLRTVASLDDSPKPPPRRLTLTPPALAAARDVLVVAKGADKARALRQVLEGDDDPRPFPARLVRDRAWIVDAAAASQLAEGRA